VQTYDTKPKRRLFEVRKTHGMAANQQVKSLHPPPLDPDVGLTSEVATKLINEVRDDLARLKWFL
jgi:hypothetical protein